MKPLHKSRIFWVSMLAGALNSALVTALQTDTFSVETRTVIASVAAACSYVVIGLRIDDQQKANK